MEYLHRWKIQMALWMLLCSQISCLDSDWGDIGADGFPGRHELACDGFPVELRCPGHDVIKVSSVEYGRRNKWDCSGSQSEMNDTNCILPSAKTIVEKRCNNQTRCSFFVSRDVFPDPCPGTKKYLKANYECVKFMFGCPGRLSRIGSEEVFSVDVLPQFGTWTKDPLSNDGHVFFAPSGSVLHEYSDWDGFIDGNPEKTYELQQSMAEGNIVVYDRNLFYVKAKSRHVIRYGLITQRRTGETALPGSEEITDKHVSLAVDETGLWVTYVGDEGRIKISLLDRYNLAVKKTWSTTLVSTESSFTFFICGVMYSVNPRSGDITYSFDTNEGSETRNIVVPFEKEITYGFRASMSSRRMERRSFLRHNASSILYNPRDRLLYSWDKEQAKAVVYKLGFGGKDTKPQFTRPNRKSPATLPHISIHSTPSRPTKFQSSKAPRPKRNFCQSLVQDSIFWPVTSAGDMASMDCMDGTGAVATWRCRVLSPSEDPEWDIEGPDTSKCLTWASDIFGKFEAGYVDRTFAIEALSMSVSNRQDGINGKWIEVISNLTKILLDDSRLPSNSEAKRILRSAVKIVSILLKKKDAWMELTKEKQTSIANELMKSVENAAFIYTDTVNLSPNKYNDKNVFVVPDDILLIQTEVRNKWLRYHMHEMVTSFPNENTSKHTAGIISDLIEVPNDIIMRQNGYGKFAIVFHVHYAIDSYLSPTVESGWEIDSNVVTATFRRPLSRRPPSSRKIRVTLKKKNDSNLQGLCVYWNYSETTHTGNWSDEGCNVAGGNSTHTICECDHLATYALLRRRMVNDSSSPIYDVSLEIVTSVGISIAIIFLTACVATLSLFKNIQSDRTTILKHMSGCLLAVEVIFLVGINQTSDLVACSIIAGLLQYFVIATFCWVALEGFQLHVLLVQVFEEDSGYKWFYGVGYGIPAVIVSVSAGIGYSSYGSSRGCFIDIQSDAIWSVVVPIALAMIVKIVFAVATIYKINKQSVAFADSAKVASVRNYMKQAFIIHPFIIVSWILGVSWINERSTVLAILFCVTNAAQGILIFVFYCVVPKKVGLEYTKTFERISCCEKMTSKNNYVTNSMTFSKHYAPGRFPPNDTQTGTRRNSIGGPFPWEVTSPKTVNSSPVSEISTNVMGNRENQPLQNWPPAGETQHFTMNPSYGKRQPQPQRPEEEEFFLAPGYNVTIRPVNQIPAQNPIQYNHLQHHRHSDHHKRYRTGLPQAPKRHHRSSTMAQGIRTNPRFGPTSHSQPRFSRDFTEPRVPHPGGNNSNTPYYWDLDPPLLRAPCVPHPNFDPSVGAQNLPPNSIIQRLRNETQPPTRSHHFKPVLGGSSAANHPPAPIKIHALAASPESRKPHTKGRRSYNISEDEGQGSSYEDHDSICNQSNIAASRCAMHDEMSISPSQSQDKAMTVSKNGQCLHKKSTNSDSDDPIVTDCSGSSPSSSFGRQYGRWSNQEMLV